MSIDFVSLAVGILLGGCACAISLAVWLWPKLRVGDDLSSKLEDRSSRLAEADSNLRSLSAEASDLKQQVARLEAQAVEKERRLSEQAESLSMMRDEVSKAFAEMSQSALKQNNEIFLDLAKQNLSKYQEAAKGDLDQRKQAIDSLVQPIKESLIKVDKQITEMGEKQASTGASITEQLRHMAENERRLQSETANLVKALRNPGQRGRWGEVQLRRVAELAGMVENCDFFEQQTHRTEDGGLRPDMVVRLPGGKTVVVDAKTPLEGYLNAIEAPDDDARLDAMKAHARQVREQIRQLGSKRYWDQFDSQPDFVVAFLPGEPMFGAALEHDPGLIEFGVENRVLIVTPVSLIALLRVVAQGWRHEALEQNAQKISDLGKDLYSRIAKLAEHFSKVGRNLDKAVVSYNDAVGALEFRVLPQVRKFKELQASTAENIETVETLERTTRPLQSPELRTIRVSNLAESLFNPELS